MKAERGIGVARSGVSWVGPGCVVGGSLVGFRESQEGYNHAMREVLLAKGAELSVICARRRVRRLALFGSAARGEFDPSRSDVDLVAEFEVMGPREHADSFFGLIEDLQALLGAPIDLIEKKPIRNPYFRQAVEESQVVLFEAA